MAYTIKVQAAEKITVQDSGEQLLSVAFDIVQTTPVEGAEPTVEVMKTARQGFPLGITVEQLETELQAVLAAFTKDVETAEATAEFAALDAQADATIAAIIDKEITN